ncbi:MAG: hypothetical protein CME06_17705 [Gemmatimonadetes bacterium]|nr:hypothetical protein [Gemmatimonadota bacterium]
MLICLCNPTSDSEVRAHAETGCRTVAELGSRCGAGTGCGLCTRHLARALHNAHALKKNEELRNSPPSDTIAA